MVEQHGAVGDPQRVVVGQRHHARAQLDAPGALGGGRDEDLRRADDLGAGGVVLADPHLVEAQAVEQLDQLEVALQAQRGVLDGGVEGSHEHPEAQPTAARSHLTSSVPRGAGRRARVHPPPLLRAAARGRGSVWGARLSRLAGPRGRGGTVGGGWQRRGRAHRSSAHPRRVSSCRTRCDRRDTPRHQSRTRRATCDFARSGRCGLASTPGGPYCPRHNI
ncbi:MAG: hypothetical protein AVDCRST_MAG24-528 [uncultured Nocardioidaceae bacterium]|uniref:Uncharacterized protein n=1 Tax=uncultured Nocardioidaceae bacterium TaxID=253824 RepID=A0A6J4L8I8_9ACTN|nr:MAG: hypothetical protein AVDCRST_MAG24-528 [uncultured Nocardioidaceae bacterium]